LTKVCNVIFPYHFLDKGIQCYFSLTFSWHRYTMLFSPYHFV
jgi:hypothetical protein